METPQAMGTLQAMAIPVAMESRWAMVRLRAVATVPARRAHHARPGPQISHLREMCAPTSCERKTVRKTDLPVCRNKLPRSVLLEAHSTTATLASLSCQEDR